MAKKKTAKKKGPVRISELRSKGKKRTKPKGSSMSGKSAYRFVSERLASSLLQKVQRRAFGVLDELQRRASEVLGGDAEKETDAPDYPKLRREWIKKRLRSTLRRKR